MPSIFVWFWTFMPYVTYPVWVPVCEPPTSNPFIWIPGACDIAAHTSRALGISVSSSLVKFVPNVFVVVSTTGDSPVTVTVSCKVATFICWSTASVWLMTTRMFSRLTDWKPASSKFSSYTPGGSAMKR